MSLQIPSVLKLVFLSLVVLTLVEIIGHLFCRIYRFICVSLMTAHDQIQVTIFLARDITELMLCSHCILSDGTHNFIAGDGNLATLIRSFLIRCTSPGISHFCKEPWFILVEYIIQQLGSGCQVCSLLLGCCYFHTLQGEQSYMYTHIHQIYFYKYLSILIILTFHIL